MAIQMIDTVKAEIRIKKKITGKEVAKGTVAYGEADRDNETQLSIEMPVE